MKKQALLTFIALAAFGSSLSAAPVLTKDNGAPVPDNQNSKTAGEKGGVLLEDVHLIQKLQRFDRERIPERVVHARGTGAHGFFESTADLSDLTRAELFKGGNTKTPVFVRFSTVVHPQGSPETLRDPRGFATKFYTSQGNWDLVGNNLPVFFIRDAVKFPDMVHAFKPSPYDNKHDVNRLYDFFYHHPECIHMFTWLQSDYGTPRTYRQMDGNSVHAYKFVNAKGEVTYVKFRWISKQGVKNFTAAEASAMQAKDYAPHTTDLYDAVGRGEFPQWELRIQTLTQAEMDKLDYDPLDATKVWTDVPWRTVGVMTLDRMPTDFFAETEQSAFAPANLVPGIEPSEDRLLQGRLFSYADTQMYRLGAHHMNIPVNAPLAPKANNNRDGALNHSVSKAVITSEPSRDPSVPAAVKDFAGSVSPLSGEASQRPISRTQNFRQAGELYRSFNETERAHLIENFGADLAGVRDLAIRTRMAAFAYKADKEYGTRLAKAAGISVEAVAADAATLKD